MNPKLKVSSRVDLSGARWELSLIIILYCYFKINIFNSLVSIRVIRGPILVNLC